MCGRFSLQTPATVVAKKFDASLVETWEPSERFVPGRSIPIIRLEGRERLAKTASWGLVPTWAKTKDIARHTFNARAETVGERPAFRDAFRKRRCLVPADGFYEWPHGHSLKKVTGPPWFFSLRTGAPFAMAGLWEEWWDPQGIRWESCTVLTTLANALVAPYHDRMPVVLPENAYGDWLASQAFQGSLGPLDASWMEAFPPEPSKEGMDGTLELDLG